VSADFNAVSPDYLETMGVRLLRGRFVLETDTATAPRVAVIDENLARALWPGSDPLGHEVHVALGLREWNKNPWAGNEVDRNIPRGCHNTHNLRPHRMLRIAGVD
jgi:hypothetical protein